MTFHQTIWKFVLNSSFIWRKWKKKRKNHFFFFFGEQNRFCVIFFISSKVLTIVASCLKTFFEAFMKVSFFEAFMKVSLKTKARFSKMSNIYCQNLLDIFLHFFVIFVKLLHLNLFYNDRPNVLDIIKHQKVLRRHEFYLLQKNLK